MSSSPVPAPRFSVVSAVYNVGRYLDDFIASIEAQDYPLEQLNVVLVDDGSTDDSLARLQAWQRRRPETVVVLTKPNGGQASARNLGIESASGEWITFTDPDDLLAPTFFSSVAKFLDQYPTTSMVASKRIVFHEDTGVRENHPLSIHFTKRDRQRDLRHDPDHFHGHAACAVFRRSEIDRIGLRFDERMRPMFEDGQFCARYLLHSMPPLVGFVQSAEYIYRKRAGGGSTIDMSWAEPGRFIAAPELGYLPLMSEASELHGAVPRWLQSMLLYELAWYFRMYDAIPSVENAAVGDVADRFTELLGQVAARLDPEAIDAYTGWRLNRLYRDILLHSFRPEPWHTPYVLVDRVDPRQNLMRVSYRFVGSPPTVEFYVDGEPQTPRHDKLRTIEYFGRPMLTERVAWLPLGTLRATFEGADVESRLSEPNPTGITLDSWTLRKRLDPSLAVLPPPGGDTRGLSRVDRLILRAAVLPRVTRRLGNAWVLLDRLDTADDSAEHLFHFLRRRRRKVNAFFVIDRDAPDYKRIRKTLPFRSRYRVIAHGSTLWKLAMLNAEHVISSHADVPMIEPRAILRLTGGTRTWRVTFLQHGVTKDDLSRWLNRKNLDVFVTSTPAEYESVAGDRNGYRYTTRETKLTGLPRFDKLLEMAQDFPADRRDLVLVAPTWRNWLARLDPHTGRPSVDPETFLQSEFAATWFGLLDAPEIRDAARRHGLKIALLLHPHLEPVTDRLNLPAHVEVLRFQGNDVRRLVARARVMVTDYSSMAFNAAYIDRPVVYFQFDRHRLAAGGHNGRLGYFDYERDGFGAVAIDHDAAVEATVAAIDHGPGPQETYAKRIAATFPQRDGKCCERVYEAVVNSTRRARPAQPTTASSTAAPTLRGAEANPG